MVAMVGLAGAGALAWSRMRVDIFPALNLPVIYVCQPYGGMDPTQMEGLIANYYEYHFLYINGIHHVESKNVQGVSLMKLYFHPGTDMAQAMAETVGYVNRSRAFMPPGTVPPFIMRFDTGSVPVGYLVLSSDTKTIGQIQDQALNRVRPMFASIPGVSAPPPFGGSQRTVVVRAEPDRLRAYNVSADDVVRALSAGNTVSPSGNIRTVDAMPLVPVNAMVVKPEELGGIPLRPDVYLRALALTGQTVNLMTLGGLALAVGILVDESTVEVENIHTQMDRTDSVALAVRRGNAETAVPRLLAMLCVLAVFIPSFFMQGAARALFVPLALAVGFSMVTSYLLSSTFVPVMSVWLLRHYSPPRPGTPGRGVGGEG